MGAEFKCLAVTGWKKTIQITFQFIKPWKRHCNRSLFWFNFPSNVRSFYLTARRVLLDHLIFIDFKLLSLNDIKCFKLKSLQHSGCMKNNDSIVQSKHLWAVYEAGDLSTTTAQTHSNVIVYAIRQLYRAGVLPLVVFFKSKFSPSWSISKWIY